ncbi:hypothetical protein [Paracoccus sp. SCSIO 75233]|uniref:hypothetical protein n=1 Tax=Paracoccus sp. SCSIO 75233 TaxID=3017782 RepID=UPI0022F106D3|nr:hypothetical protein [Paracoccus sp. SCSIO 75233]WBU54432.1 hypothetical protein PAF12_06260 [Paracoccus sp. SCSIO 75233]
MTYEKHLALGLVSSLAERFGPSSKIAKELPGWIEYLTDVECPERPQARPELDWWVQIRSLLDDLCKDASYGDGSMVRVNAMRIGRHFGLTELEARILEFFANYRIFEMFEHVVDQAMRTNEVTTSFLLGQFAGAEQGEARAALRPQARLRAFGLLQCEDRHWVDQSISYLVPPRLANAMLAEVDDVEELVALM